MLFSLSTFFNTENNFYLPFKILTAMISAEEKEDLIDWIKNLENQSLLKHLMELKVANETVFEVSDQQREAIEIALKSIEEGKGIPHEGVMKNMKTKYPKYFNG